MMMVMMMVMLVLWYTASRTDELRLVTESVSSVREILISVNAQVDEREKHLKLLDICDRLDARSTATLNSNTFTVSCDRVIGYWHHNVGLSVRPAGCRFDRHL